MYKQISCEKLRGLHVRTPITWWGNHFADSSREPPTTIPGSNIGASDSPFWIRHCVHPSISSLVRPSVRPCVHSSVRSSVCPSVRLSFRLSVHPSVRPSILSFIRLSACLSARLSVLPSVHPSNVRINAPAYASSVRQLVRPTVQFSETVAWYAKQIQWRRQGSVLTSPILEIFKIMTTTN